MEQFLNIIAWVLLGDPISILITVLVSSALVAALVAGVQGRLRRTFHR